MNKISSVYFETHAGRDIQLWKELVRPEKPVGKNGRPLKGGVDRFCWIGYVDDISVANECEWQGGTRRAALAHCREFAQRLARTAKQAIAVTEALAFSDQTEWFPIREFVADVDDLTLSTDQLLKLYLVQRRRVGIAIGAEE